MATSLAHCCPAYKAGTFLAIKGKGVIFSIAKKQNIVYRNIVYSNSLLFRTSFHTKIIAVKQTGSRHGD